MGGIQSIEPFCSFPCFSHLPRFNVNLHLVWEELPENMKNIKVLFDMKMIVTKAALSEQLGGEDLLGTYTKVLTMFLMLSQNRNGFQASVQTPIWIISGRG